MASSRHSSADEDEEVFEITDFTTASDWEKFIAQITEAVTEWQLTCLEHVHPLRKNEFRGIWEQFSKEIRFSNAVFMLTLYRLKQAGGDEVYLEESGDAMEDELRMPLYMDDMMSTFNDFPPRAHCLVRWYGFRSFLVLSLISSGGKNEIGLISESKCNLLLSSACIVLSESGCEVPIFIQIQENWRRMYSGRCIGTGMQTEFEMVHLKKCPPQYQHLSGLLHVFKSKIGPTVSTTQVSARFTYVLSNWGESGVWPREMVDPEKAAYNFSSLLFGSLDDPIGDLHLSAVWPSITEDLIIENDVHSDFQPNTAPVWTIRMHYTDNPDCLLSSYLKELLKVRTCKDSVSSLVSTSSKSQDAEQDIGQVFSKLTDSSIRVKQIVPLVPELTSGISKIVANQTSKWTIRKQASAFTTMGPISQNHMEHLMEFLLQENQPDPVDEREEEAEDYKKAAFVHETEHQLKSAPKDSLTYRLALCITVANFCHGGASAIAQLWHEFIQEMRYRFENAIKIPGMRAENPDLRCCLLHQKLQMLNCCIHHKILRETGHNLPLPQQDDVPSLGDKHKPDVFDQSEEQCGADQALTNVNTQADRIISASSVDGASPPLSPSWQDEVSSIDDDEFFECSDGDSVRESVFISGKKLNSSEDPDEKIAETKSQNALNELMGAGSSNDSVKSVGDEKIPKKLDDVVNASTLRSAGRLKQFGTAKLLNCDAPLYIPVTQEPAPLTEDALEEQTKIFSSLGDSAEGALLRRKMQSASLLSDMESFKAANPNCILEDFVRWYSPRDYEEGEASGTLSDRMKIPGNLWQTMWQTAKAIPARRQKRLFDDTKEGEKVLHFLASLQPKDLVLRILPMSFHEAINILQEKSSSSVPSVPKLCVQILSQACKLFQSNYMEKWSQMDDLLAKILFAETLVERAMSLRHKFAKIKDVDKFVKRLMEHPELTLEGASNGDVGKIVKQYFSDQMLAKYSNEEEKTAKHSDLPPPTGREYILRTTTPRPAPQSRALPHRLYAVLIKNEFRLAGAFSSDTVFF